MLEKKGGRCNSFYLGQRITSNKAKKGFFDAIDSPKQSKGCKERRISYKAQSK